MNRQTRTAQACQRRARLVLLAIFYLEPDAGTDAPFTLTTSATPFAIWDKVRCSDLSTWAGTAAEAHAVAVALDDLATAALPAA